MGISIFENMASDTLTAALFKLATGPEKTDAVNFSQVFEGCVKERGNAVKPEGEAGAVKADTGNVFAAGPALPLNVSSADNAVVSNGTVDPQKANTGDTPLTEVVLPSNMPTEDNVAMPKGAVDTAKTDIENAHVAVAVPPLNVPTADKATAAKGAPDAAKVNTGNAPIADAILSSNVPPVNNAAAAKGAPDAVKTNTGNAPDAGAAQPLNSSIGEKTVKAGGKGEEEAEGSDEAKETDDTEEADYSSLLAPVLQQANRFVFAAASQKVTGKASDDESSEVWGSKTAGKDWAQVPNSSAQEKDANAAVEVKAVFPRDTLNTIASGKASAEEIPVADEKADLRPVQADRGRQESGMDKKVSETANIKVPAGEKKLLNDENIIFAPKKADAVSTGSPEPKIVPPVDASELNPVKDTNEAVKHPKDHPALSTADSLRADNVNADTANTEAASEKHESPLYGNTASGGSDGFERPGDDKGDGKDGLKADTGKGFEHGVLRINNEKFRADAVEAKPAEAAKTEAVFDKLTAGVKMSLARGGKEVSLSLTPEHLGALHIKLSVDEGSVKARILVESDAAKTILDSDSGKLKEVFARHGLSLDRYTIELSTNSYSAGANPFSENGARENTHDRRTVWNRVEERNEQTAETKAYRQSENTRRSTGGVDLFV